MIKNNLIINIKSLRKRAYYSNLESTNFSFNRPAKYICCKTGIKYGDKVDIKTRPLRIFH